MATQRARRLDFNDEVGRARYHLIKNAIERVNKAFDEGYFLESITILESLIADRLESILTDTEGKDVSFRTLGNLIYTAKDSNTIPQEIKDSIINRLLSWKDERNKALHQMVKLESGNLHDWETRYGSFESTVEEGVVLFKELSKYRQRLNRSLKNKEQ